MSGPPGPWCGRCEWVRSVDVVEDCVIRWRLVVGRGVRLPTTEPQVVRSAMFLGEFQHSLDAKGRVILPARFREQLEGGAVMARALDGCLAVYPRRRVRPGRPQAPRSPRARRHASARPPAPSSPARSRSRPTSRAGSRSRSTCASTPHLDREVMVAGSFDHIEIWDAQRCSPSATRPASHPSSTVKASTTSSERRPYAHVPRSDS